MNDEEILDDGEVEIDEEENDIDIFVQQAARRNSYTLDARRRIEQLMELKRLRELDERISLNDLD